MLELLAQGLQKGRRRAKKAERGSSIEQIEEASEQRRLAFVMALSRRAARCWLGAEKRHGRRHVPLPLDKLAWLVHLGLPRPEGGMIARAIFMPAT